jgi:DNA methyltransferase 1-associated protein 1
MDVADLLGIQPREQPSMSEEASRILEGKMKSVGGPRVGKKPNGMSREVYGLLGHDSIAPSMQTNKVISNAAFKTTKRVSALRGKWVLAPIYKSSETHNISAKEAAQQTSTPLYHWVKADMQYAEYPYSKFNIRMDRITYSDEEYDHLLQSEVWSRSETDALMSLCHKYDLRWPVIVDRYSLQPPRACEDIQERYYSIQAKLRAHRTGRTDINAKTNEVSTTFDIEQERTRRHRMDQHFRNTKDDEAKEASLKKELKEFDANMKKLKKTSKPSALPGSEKAMANKLMYASTLAELSGLRAGTGGASSHPTGTGPIPGIPALQSTRLDTSSAEPADPLMPQIDSGTSLATVALSKTLLSKMTVLLQELGLPPVEDLVPTRAVCDGVDQVKKQAVTLLSLQSAISKREKELSMVKLNTAPDMMAKATSGTEIALSHNCLISKMPAQDPRLPFVLPSSSVMKNTPNTNPSSATASATAFGLSTATAASSAVANSSKAASGSAASSGSFASSASSAPSEKIKSGSSLTLLTGSSGRPTASSGTSASNSKVKDKKAEKAAVEDAKASKKVSEI